ncbi:MAG: DUF2764 family protein [Acutalibacteraceae bacterium]|nr:DUF2764 family protein [Acutalibacteraceae bacterium]
MAEYYLISQLPSLDGINENTPLPITEERFAELCERFLGKKAYAEFNRLTLLPPKSPEKSASQLVEKWNEGERNLRLALAKLRADKLNKQYKEDERSFPAELVQAARTAIECESPMEAEKFLNRYRLEFLESLRPTDSFSEEYVYYYGLKLRLLLRIRKFDTQSGETAYRNIYDSVMNGEKSEVIQ